MGDIYEGNSFSVAYNGGDEWTIWRICDDDGNREQIILTTDAMDEMGAYFTRYYREDRAEITALRAAAKREP